MPAFSVLQGQRARRPSAVVLLSPSHFSPAWPEQPQSDVAVGVRQLSEAEVQTIKAEAAKNARAFYPDADEVDDLLNDCFSDELMKLAVARAACSPNDATVPYFAAPDDMVGEAWLPTTIRRIWDELERVTIQGSPVAVPLGDEEMGALCLLLQGGVVAKLADGEQLRLRKLLRFALEELASVEEVLG